MYRVIDPATGELVEEFSTATDQEVASALDRSDAAFTKWSGTPVDERARILTRVSEIYRERSTELAEVIRTEMGKAVPEGKGEAVLSSLIYRYFAEHAEEFLADEPLRGPKRATAVIQRRPVGSILGIMPWNFPYYQVARFAAPNLALGNTVLLKHAPNCPRSSQLMEDIFTEAGLPQDAYLNLYATNEQVSGIILASPKNHGVSLTGSERAGAAVAAEAGRNLKKVVLELGGSDPCVVLDTDDLQTTVSTLFASRMGNTGQACNAPKRMIVLEELYADFVEAMTSAVREFTPDDPRQEGSKLSPLSSAGAADLFLEQVRDTVAQGATAQVGGNRYDGPGAFVEPVVLTGVEPGMRAYHEELFGPAVIIHRAASEEDAIRIANDTPYGLGASVFSTDAERARRVGERIEAGMVFINTPEQSREFLPFGGVKRSGVGRELGPLAMDEFVNKRLVYTAEPAGT